MVWWVWALTVLTIMNLAGVFFLWMENGVVMNAQRVLYKMVYPLYHLGIIQIVNGSAPAQPKLSVVPKPTEDK